jgi:hypothetical protein
VPEYRIKNRLLAVRAVTDLVGARVVPVFDELAEYPGIVFSQEADEANDDLGGTSDSGQVRVSIECWGRNYDEAKRLSAAVKRALVMEDWWTAEGTPPIGMVHLDDASFAGRVQQPGRNGWFYWWEHFYLVDYG